MLGYKGLRALGLITESKGVTCFISTYSSVILRVGKHEVKSRVHISHFHCCPVNKKNNTSLTEILKMTGFIYHWCQKWSAHTLSLYFNTLLTKKITRIAKIIMKRMLWCEAKFSELYNQEMQSSLGKRISFHI